MPAAACIPTRVVGVSLYLLIKQQCKRHFASSADPVHVPVPADGASRRSSRSTKGQGGAKKANAEDDMRAANKVQSLAAKKTISKHKGNRRR